MFDELGNGTLQRRFAEENQVVEALLGGMAVHPLAV
jgi:hypothetical protein